MIPSNENSEVLREQKASGSVEVLLEVPILLVLSLSVSSMAAAPLEAEASSLPAPDNFMSLIPELPDVSMSLLSDTPERHVISPSDSRQLLFLDKWNTVQELSLESG